MSRISENDLVLPSLHLLSDVATKTLSTTELGSKLRDLLNPNGEDLVRLTGRTDDKFSQKVRNLRVHRKLENLDYATFSNGSFTITQNGENYLSTKLDELALIIDEEIFINTYSSQISSYYLECITSLATIEELVNNETFTGSQKIKFFNMLYSSIITSLETYLGDAIKYNINGNEDFIQRFVESFKGYKKTECSFNNIINLYSTLEEKVNDSLMNLMYHNLRIINGIYKSTFNISFPDFSALSRSITIRHDLVHRNGKKKDGQVHNITKENILELKAETVSFVQAIENHFVQIQSNSVTT